MITEETIEKLKTIETHLKVAVEGHYLRNLTREQAKLVVEAYEEIFDRKFTKSMSCSKCAYDTTLAVAEKYFEYMKETAKPKATKAPKTNDTKTAKVNMNKKVKNNNKKN